MSGVPHQYSEWVDVLKQLKDKSNDDKILQIMYQGTIEWQSGVAERFAKKLTEAINFRMNQASEKFQKELMRATNQEKAVIEALLQLRKEMHFLAKAIALPVIPEQDRNQYHQLVVDQANAMQKSLEETARRDRSGKLSCLIKNHRINEF